MLKVISFINKSQIFHMTSCIIKDFYVKEGLQRASSLAYTILMSFVPFLISIASITTFFLPKEAYSKLEVLVLKSSLPVMGEQISNYMETFHKHAGELSFLSFIFLFITSIFMISSLSHHLIKMYGEEKENISFIYTIINYVIFVSGSLLFSVGSIITSYLTLVIKLDYSVILYSLTIILSIIAFTMIYKFLPANKVKYKEALIAGIVAGVSFEIAKKLFAIYIKYFATESIIYGTLATIPIFLLWIYICCLILLGGSSLIAWLRRTKQSMSRI